MRYPDAVEELTALLKQLPGVGRRGAERLAFALLEWERADLAEAGKLIAALPDLVGQCPECGCISDAGKRCAVCARPDRDPGLICVVETTQQLYAIEASATYRGRYHVLGGRLSPLTGETGEGLNIDALLARAKSGAVREIIMATSPDVEGRATAAYLAGLMRDMPIKITRPALGLPAGANLSYADGPTIAAALGGRVSMEDNSHGR
ncbi:MAG: recombination mediator RecR [Victivallaceae bacterium]|nr:recombination mediator RecR [Victivallaceae bacterium]